MIDRPQPPTAEFRDPDLSSSHRMLGKPGLRTAVYTVALGVLGTALWELIARPGLGGLGRFLFAVATFGSTRIRDFAYESAALDPTPLPGLVLFTVLSLSPWLITYEMWSRAFGRRRRRESIKAEVAKIDAAVSLLPENMRAAALDEAYRIRIARIHRKLRIIGGVGVAYSAGLAVAAAITFGVVNEAVAVHRVFHRNLAACAPYLTAEGEKLFRSQFAQMMTKRDYEVLDSSLAVIARQHNIRTRSVGELR